MTETVIPLHRPAPTTCQRCNNGVLVADPAQLAFWKGDGMMIVRNIPAMSCPICGERYLGEQEVLLLQRLRNEGPPDDAPTLEVPLVDFAEATRTAMPGTPRKS